MAQRSVEALEKIFSKFSKDDPDFIRAFDLVFAQIPEKGIFGTSMDLKMDVLDIFVPLCEIKYVRNKLDEFLKTWSESLPKPTAGRNPSGPSYIEKEIQDVQYDIIAMHDGEKPARKFAENHVENEKFRILAIEYAVSDKNYARAIDLCLGGERLEASSPGYVSVWKMMRYDIYEKTGDNLKN